MSNQFIGRRVTVGFGIETTPGTEVAPTDGIRQTKFGFQRKDTVIDNDAALGRVEDVDDSAIVQQWAEGPLEVNVSDITIGYLLYAIGGSVSTAANADASGLVKDHTGNIANTNTPPTLTVVRKDPITCRRHGLGVVEDLEISWKPGEWVKGVASIKAKAGVTSSDTIASPLENKFTSKHVSVKLATNVAGLGAATKLATKGGKIKISRPATQFFPDGQIDPSEVTNGKVTVTGELTLQYTATQYEDLWIANTPQAMQIAFVNSDVTIGTAARPGLTFTAPKSRFRIFSMNDDLDNVIEQTLSFKCELDTTAGYMLRTLLTNLKTLYV